MKQIISGTDEPVPDSSRVRSGFTLVEMLISVALVLLMMTLFAQVFELATGAMTLQQAISENDQQVRTFITVMRGDLRKRTMRAVTPFMPNEINDLQIVPFAARSGYFYLSLNDPANRSDNVLQFTVRSSINIDSSDDTPYYGRATVLRGSGTPNANFLGNSNQPEHDDGQITPNGAALSTAAQVSYFVRAGRLYRRVLLLREPLPVSGAVSAQPKRTDGGNPLDYFAPADGLTNGAREYIKEDGGSGAPGEIWEDFDFSVYRLNSGTHFLSVDDLNNATATAIGNPPFRFGFDQATGISREFSHGDPAASGAFFMGRFTHEETSHANFNFPQTGTNRFSYTAFTAADTDTDGTVDGFVAGSRRGEDLLLTNVHSFEILVWDTRLGAFVPVGHSQSNALGEPGDYNIARNLQLNRFDNTGAADPLIVVPGDAAAWSASVPAWQGRVLDTWHPTVNVDGDPAKDDPPPYRPLNFYPMLPGYSGPSVAQWSPNTPYTSEDGNGNGVLDAGEDGTGGFPANGRLDGDKVFPFHKSPYYFEMYYECVTPGTSGPSSEDLNGNGVLDTVPTNEDTNANGVLDDDEPTWGVISGQKMNPAAAGAPVWRTVINIRPLSAIQIRVRFLHVQTNKIRQLTLVHSMVD